MRSISKFTTFTLFMYTNLKNYTIVQNLKNYFKI